VSVLLSNSRFNPLSLKRRTKEKTPIRHFKKRGLYSAAFAETIFKKDLLQDLNSIANTYVQNFFAVTLLL
jgi:hypothetical protein